MIEEILDFVSLKESLEESSIMVGLDNYEEKAYFFMLLLFFYICFFMPLNIQLGMLNSFFCYVFFGCILFVYFKISRRSHCTISNEFYIWRGSFEIVSFLGVIFILLRYIFLQISASVASQDESSKFSMIYYLALLEHAIIVWKFIDHLIENKIPKWVSERFETYRHNRSIARDAVLKKFSRLKSEGNRELREVQEIEFERAFN